MKRAHGMTLVEVMVAMAIFSLVMAGVMSALIENQQQVLMHGRMADMQTSMRTAVTQLERTLDLAGYGIDPNYALEPVVLDAAGNDTPVIRDGIGPYGNDELVVHYRDPLFRRVASAVSTTQITLATPMNVGETLDRGQRLLVLCASGSDSAYVTVSTTAGSPINVINLNAGAAAPFNQQNKLLGGSCFSSGSAVVLRVERRQYFVAFVNDAPGNLVRPALLVRRGVDANGDTVVDQPPTCATAPFIACTALNDAELVALDVEQLQVAYGINQPQRCLGGAAPGCTDIATMWNFGNACSGGPCGPDADGNWMYGDQPGTNEVPKNSAVAAQMWSGTTSAPTPLRPPLLAEAGTVCAGTTMAMSPDTYCGYGAKRRYTGHPGNVRLVRFTIGARTPRPEARLGLTRMVDLATDPMENLTTAEVGTGACAAASTAPWAGPQCSRHVRSRLTGTVALKNMMQRTHFVPPVGAGGTGNVDGG